MHINHIIIHLVISLVQCKFLMRISLYTIKPINAINYVQLEKRLLLKSSKYNIFKLYSK